ncbi:SusE domain-containing protein [Kordia zhangzhouensis]|uniref:SusE domain-containing protein n=1 Tax=Kordia zhangzhouensis TaxID=1620405 RepID=UPI0006298208|nr:SusE domain-containing protein [Kordia zhangzhouensis]
MKKLNKLSAGFLALVAFVGFNACSDDDNLIIASPQGGPQLVTPASGTSIVLTAANEQNLATTLVWNDADYGAQTAINYDVQVALSGTEFAAPIAAGSTNERFISWTNQQLNDVVIAAGLSPFVAGDIDVRVISSIGTQDAEQQISDVLTLNVTPYTTSLPKIAVPGNHQGWDPATAPRLAASGFGASDYEGYVWLETEYKFVAPDDTGNFAWGNTDWGDDGSFSGILTEDGEVNVPATPGYYLVQVDTENLTYSATQYSNWGLIGSATPTGWDSDNDMTYDPATQTFSITLNLTADEIKFRANDDWGWNYGDTGADGSLENGGDNIAVPAAGNYTVVLDLSNPREYTYTLTQN